MNKRKIALVGAYERDNFGDLLFGHVTRRYLGQYDVILTAPLPGSVDQLMGDRVRDYRLEFEAGREIDAIWTVGGQLGGARPHSPGYNYPGKPPAGTAGLESPYIPRPSAFRAVRHVPLIVNSVGVGGVLRADSLLNSRLRAALAEADIVSVRDRASAETMEHYGIPFLTAPDVVHTIASHVTAAPRRDEIAIQFTTKHFSDAEITGLIDWIVTSRELRSFTLVFFAAGVAPHHDSLELYDSIAQRVRDQVPMQGVRVDRDRDPLAIARLISSSRAVIATSLHVRIIACAYGVPRVAWERHKLRSCCLDWDPLMPFDADIGNIESRLRDALRAGPDVRGVRLAELAERNVEHLLELLRQELQASPSRRLLRRTASLAIYASELQRLAD